MPEWFDYYIQLVTERLNKMDLKKKEALNADDRSRAAFNAWQAEKNPENRKLLKEEYTNAAAYAASLWEEIGPDPLLSQLAKAQQVQDELEGH